jgi:hypothetical protein
MDITVLLTTIANFGFPIVVAAFLLIRTEGKLETLTSAIADLSKTLAQLQVLIGHSELKDAGDPNRPIAYPSVYTI